MDFEYRTFSKNDLHEVSPSLYNDKPDEIFSPTEETTLTVLKDNKIIAFIDFNYYHDIDVVSIDLFEVFERSKGTGTQIINEIQRCENVSCIEVNPLTDRSVRFWRRMGFHFVDSETMQWKKGQANEIT